MKKYFVYLPACIAPVLFLALKLSSNTIRLSDTNVYFYTAYQLLQGKLLYKDIFFTNFPVFPYVSALYLAISGNNIYFYYFTSAIEVAITSFIIYLIIFNHWQSRVYALSAQVIYLFSFIILATSDHQSGVFLASLFTAGSYFFFQKKQFLLVGVLTALAVLTKAYFLPLAATYFVYILLKERKYFIKFLVGTASTGIIILLPFLLFTREHIINDIFYYSLTRGAGTNKWQVIQFFIFRDFLLSVLLLSNLLLFKKHLFFTLFSIFSILFLLFYQDIYYLYLNSLVPIVILSLPIFMDTITTRYTVQRLTIPTLLIFPILLNLIIYIPNYRSLQAVSNVSELLDTIHSLHPDRIYGTNDLTPLLAYLTHTPMLDNLTDTNTNIFRKNLLDAQTETSHALTHRTVVIVHGLEYPEYNARDLVLDEIVDKKVIEARCRLRVSKPVKAEGITNRINLFQCF
jgi:hypothetical protein